MPPQEQTPAGPPAPETPTTSATPAPAEVAQPAPAPAQPAPAAPANGGATAPSQVVLPKGGKSKKKLLAIIGGSLALLLVVGGLSAYFVLLRAPSTDALCGHLYSVAIKDGAKQAGVDEATAKAAVPESTFKTSCVSSVNEAKQKEGSINAAKEGRCIMKADTIAAIEKCGTKL